ncbi:chemotaxis protein : CheA signal transduction histidine kinase OS=Crinalium epipsammum PCC 9333 GN=Cri9333_3522 PE=4 SV=1: Hpt: H-kinase_dim: HATPase_c: CheW [Gemmataceae bacterium]|nr:chemotaxis protein : CheA signal transduction histidine kinase OS=Crinalium epipsammum PCC 9333 GN=Cri9333_3522 PE=4 SV=1: Hpt: H-kinase_dim: HATPase_c: CheW [Gemmataceae bacterium]VTT98768.1 chemotaxis protein : CheA signal transduction histidine kinase OS=Crinalium epipsammum PCC 9333 GN=Cri9333_3522 PE=4 SV=1: Hpt: H-kinase_dim: HATPase_c: CheW [Gemmataceae bacterium]
MSTNDHDELSELFADYLVECDEHLTGARGVLLALEGNPGGAGPSVSDTLFRHFHTLKGLSGIAGVREAERIAHHLESYLAEVRRGTVALTPDGADALVDGVKALEAAIAAHRDGLSPPETGPLITRVEALVAGAGRAATGPSAPPASVAPDKQEQIRAAVLGGARAWRVTFVPSAALAERGVTVGATRERLRAAGEIVSAEPVTLPGGGISFTFLVTSADPGFAERVAGEGVAVAPYDPPVPAAPPPAPPGAALGTLTPRSVVRVDLFRLDELMTIVGELVVTRARLDGALERVAASLPAAERRELAETSLTVERQLRHLREGVMRVRLVPVRDVFARMRFVVRDLARETGQGVDLHLSGEDTEIDKYVVERLADPLLHLVRNAISHGLEPAAERVAAGKPLRGRLDLRAAAAGGAAVIEVEDDGRGIDPERVLARARAAGLVPPGGWADPSAALDLICAPGFSTRDATDRVSGRGVGMDVVRRAVEELGGTLDLASRPGRGTRFTVRLPLTLAIADALIVAVGTQTYAAPQTAVREVVLVEPGAVTTLENHELLRHHSGVLPLLRLCDLFGTPRPAGASFALLVGEGRHAVAVAVDRVLGLREVVVRRLSDPLVQVPGLAGATELGDGRAVLILDAVGLARYARTRRRTP